MNNEADDLRLDWQSVMFVDGRRKADCLSIFETSYAGVKLVMAQDGFGDRGFVVPNPRNRSGRPLFRCGTEKELIAFIDKLATSKFNATFAEVLRLRSLCEENGIDPDGACQESLEALSAEQIEDGIEELTKKEA